MIYNGYFRDITDDDNLYQVKITTSTGTAQSNITLGGTPFTTEMDDNQETLYKPVKYQSATATILTKDYNFDIYSAKAQGTKVELLNDTGKVLWTGYATPNLYDMGFNEESEEVEIECIDALSTLQYIKYSSTNKSVVTFLDIIRKVLKSCNAYNYFYVSNNTQLTDNGTATILDKLYISENNFFEKKEDDETDDDVAWTNQEVLEEICQYLGLTAIADGDSVYFLDYDAIKNGMNSYYKYAVNTTATPTLETISYNKTITASDYSESGSSLSLDNVYNKVSIKDDLYTFDTIIPDMYDNLTNITKSSDSTLSGSTNVNNGMYGEVVQSEIGNSGSTANNNMIVMLDRVKNPQKGEYKDYNVVFVKYFVNPNYKFYQYSGSSKSQITSLNYTDTKSIHGAFIGKFGVKKLDKDYSYMEQWIAKIYGKQITLDDWLARNEISSVDFTNYIVLLNPSSGYISNDSITNYPYFETTVTDNSALFGGNNSYLVISGSYNFHYFEDDPYPIPSNESDIAEGRFSMDAGQTYLLAKLKWGSLYWNGTNWTSTESTFKIPYLRDDASGGDRRADATMFKDIQFVNTVNWRIGTNEKGYLISLPDEGVISGLPILTIYKPFDPNYHSSESGDNKGQYYKHSCVFLKDFQIKAIVGDPTYSDVNDTDTIYTNVIDTGFVNELDEIKFKICTWDNKKPNYSAVAYYNGSSLQYLDKTYNIACKSGESGWNGSTGSGFRQEEHFIYRLVNQYSTPSIKLTLNLRNDNKVYGLYNDTTLTGKDFIVDSINIDWKMNKQEIKIIEKK